MSQWAEVRHMHLVDGVPKKQIGQRLGMDVKTVRRAVAQAPARRAVSRPRYLDRWRAQIEHWLRQDRRLTAKRLRRLLLPVAGPVSERTVRWYVARLKAAAAAVIDRIVHHATVLTTNGDSYRLKVAQRNQTAHAPQKDTR